LKKNECILHVGMHKTGSTSIQSALQSLGKNSKVCYFNFGHPNHTERIVSLFSRNRVCLAHKKMNWSQDKIEEFKKETLELFDKNIQQCKSERMIISGEGIIGLSKDELEDLKSFLSDYFKKIKVIAYIRPPGEYIESYFQELVKLGTGKFVVENIFPKYKTTFEKFDDVFGRDNTEYRMFDKKTLKNGDVVSDFFSWCDIGKKFISGNRYTANESLSKNAISLLYIYHKFGPGYGKGPNVIRENNMMISRLKNIDGDKLRFSREILEKIFSKNIEEVRWIESRLGVDFHENTASDTTTVSSEADLLNVSDEILIKLGNLLGKKIEEIPEKEEEKIEWICSNLHNLRKNNSPREIGGINSGISTVGPALLAKKIKRNHSEILHSNIEFNRGLTKIIEEVFKELKSLLPRDNTKRLSVNGFGKIEFVMDQGDEIIYRLRIPKDSDKDVK